MRSPTLLQQEAEKCATDVIAELGVTSLPVLPIEIARQKEIAVQPFPSTSPGIAGCLMMNGNNFGIGYANHLNNEGFVNFTVGHELGHYFLPGHVEYLFRDGATAHYSQTAFTSSDPYEKQADAFSANLLMPQGLFLAASRKTGVGLKSVKALANLCKTSLNATAIRYGQLIDDPIAVIVSSGPQVHYAFMSRTLAELPTISPLRPGDELPPSSATARFNRDFENVLRSEEVESTSCLSEWFADAPRHEMNEDVIGLGKYGRTLTVLFTQDEIDSDDEEEIHDRRFKHH